MIEMLSHEPFTVEVLGNKVLAWLSAASLLIVTFLFLAGIRVLAAGRLRRLQERTGVELFGVVSKLARRTSKTVLFLGALYAASLLLTLPDQVHHGIRTVFVVALLLQSGFWAGELIVFTLRRALTEDQRDAERSAAVGLIVFVSQLAVWLVVLLLVMDNFGIDVTALVAGLGIGGVAVALAVQNVLGDLLASLSIILDKPFVVGDFIVIDTLSGTVERIGIKSTRLKSLSGEQLVLSNSDLLNSRIRNFKRMFERRSLFSVGVTYQTPREKLESVPNLIRAIIEAQPGVRFDRAHLKQFGPYAIEFEIVFFVLNPEFNFYMDTQQRINIEILRCFEEQKIEFAYPTQTLIVQGDKTAVNGAA